MNSVDDGPNDGETALPPAVAAERPRLNLRHLLAITAFTAAALAPMRLQQDSLTRLGDSGATIVREPTVASQAVSVVWGIASGGSLFVVVALFVWARRGYKSRLDPGHWIAIHLASQWAMVALLWGGMFPFRSALPFSVAMIALASFVLSLGFFLWYLNLARRRYESGIWRFAYVMLALAPVAGYVAGIVLMFASSARWQTIEHRIVVMMIPQIGATGGLILVLVAAMASDFRRDRRRHWTHWLAVSLKVLLLIAMALSYFALIANPPLITR
jgi:hypothetical protein